MHFVPKDYFDTLNPQEKAGYVRTQKECEIAYRALLVHGVKMIDLPTTVTDNNIPLSIQEWLLIIPDYQQRILFLQSREVNENEIELRFITTNKVSALKWINNAIVHISRVLYPIQLASAFTEQALNHLTEYNMEPWDPPPPPTIQFMKPSKDAWKNIPKKVTSPTPNNSRKKNTPNSNNSRSPTAKNRPPPIKHKTSKIDKESDNHTVITVMTQASYTQDTISELQNTSQQHQQALNEHTQQLESLDARLQTQLARVHTNLETLNE
jgi:hypothetical protein